MSASEVAPGTTTRKAAQEPIPAQPRRFYDGGVDAGEGQPEIAPDPGCDPRIELVRVIEEGREEFAMRRRIAYRDRHLGELLVPRETRTFRSDLTSVPAFFTWLVPKTGEHLPATLLHDGLIHWPDEPTYVSTDHHVVLRAEADRVLRDAMADSRHGADPALAGVVGGGDGDDARRPGNGLVHPARVALSPDRGPHRRGRRRARPVGDARPVRHPARLPSGTSLDGRPQVVRRAGRRSVGRGRDPAGAGAPVGPFRIAGAVLGVSLALLLHVTVALLLLTGLYQALEKLTRKAPKAALALAWATAPLVLLVFVVVLLQQ